MLTLICGVPRAGKTTFSRRFEGVIHLDEIGKPSERYANVNRAVSAISGDVVVEGIYNRTEQRTQLVQNYRGYGKRVCIWLDTPKEVVRARPHGGIMFVKFVPPTIAEGWDEIKVIKEG